MVEFDQKHYEPIKHTTLSRAGHALGEGAQSGFWTGLKSGGIAALVLPAVLGGLGFYAGWSALAIAGAVAAGVAGSVIAAPLIAGVAVIGTGVGLLSGAKRGNERTGKEHMAARYVDGYEAQMASMQNELAQMFEAQRPIVVQQPAPAPHAIADAGHAHKPHTHEKPHHEAGAKERPGDKYAHASTRLETDGTTLNAATVSRDGLMNGPQLAAAR